MSVQVGALATLNAKAGKGAELAAFLVQARELAVAETGTASWYAFKISETAFGVFDTFETNAALEAHLGGEIPQALGRVADHLLAEPPSIQTVELIAVK
jgi:quinol monooxygenase YgiN